MATYAIGDIQGCYTSLRRLLSQIPIDPAKDKLWFVGDLVNRGPDSLAVLRFVKGLGNQAVVVLGNHDLHLLARAEGHNRNARKDNLDSILTAPDRDELLDWLRHRPLAHYDAKKDVLMVHAGVPPQWDLAQTLACARELEASLRGPGYQGFLGAMYGDEPSLWSQDLTGINRLRFITNCLTRMRFCNADGRLDLIAKGPLGSQSQGYLPWFQARNRATQEVRIVFGHWSALGWFAADNVWCLDTGCLWGGDMTALRLRPKGPCEPIRVDCPGYRRPKLLTFA
jgi:bis(5'-nucleosyl)-tetraphosphatase (symmetrical)